MNVIIIYIILATISLIVVYATYSNIKYANNLVKSTGDGVINEEEFKNKKTEQKIDKETTHMPLTKENYLTVNEAIVDAKRAYYNPYLHQWPKAKKDNLDLHVLMPSKLHNIKQSLKVAYTPWFYEAYSRQNTGWDELHKVEPLLSCRIIDKHSLPPPEVMDEFFRLSNDYIKLSEAYKKAYLKQEGNFTSWWFVPKNPTIPK